MANQLGLRLPRTLPSTYFIPKGWPLSQSGGSTTMNIFPYIRYEFKSLPLLSSPGSEDFTGGLPARSVKLIPVIRVIRAIFEIRDHDSPNIAAAVKILLILR